MGSLSGEATHQRDFVRRLLGDARALPGTSILTSAADFKPGHRSSMPSDEPTPPRRAVVSFHKTSSKRRNIAAPLRRISQQCSARAADRESSRSTCQMLDDDGRCPPRTKRKLPPDTHTKIHTLPYCLRSNPLQPRASPGPAARAKTPPRRRGAPGGNNLSRFLSAST